MTDGNMLAIIGPTVLLVVILFLRKNPFASGQVKLPFTGPNGMSSPVKQFMPFWLAWLRGWAKYWKPNRWTLTGETPGWDVDEAVKGQRAGCVTGGFLTIMLVLIGVIAYSFVHPW